MKPARSFEQMPYLKPFTFVSFTTAEVTAGESNNLIGADCRKSLLLQLILSTFTFAMWYFTIISSNDFKGHLCSCNDISISNMWGFSSSIQSHLTLYLLPCFFYRDLLGWESVSNAICCWYWPLCVDVPHPCRPSSSWVPEQQCFTLYPGRV